MSFPVSLEGTITDVKECSSTQKHPLGTRLVLQDGRVFHYAKNAATQLAVGKICCTAAQFADEEVDLTIVAAADGTTSVTQATVAVAYSTAAITCAKNRFADGYMFVNTGTGAGQSVRLRSAYDSTGNDAGGSSTGATVEVYFADENYFSVALDTSASKVGLVQNPYSNVVLCIAWADFATSAVPVGVPVCTITASYYGWLQTWGPCPVLMGNAPVEGNKVYVGGSSTGTAGDANSLVNMLTSGTGIGGAVDHPQIGIAMAGDTDAEYALVYLMIAP